MLHWQQHAGLAGVRDAKALARLSPAERTEWEKLWQEVEVLRRRAARTK
jgi:hypothetical protein